MFLFGYFAARLLAPAPTHESVPESIREHEIPVGGFPQNPEKAQKQGAPPVYPAAPPEYPLRNSGTNREFQQMGVLVLNRKEKDPDPVLLPLFGRKLPTRDRWEYYCASDKYHMMRLPVVYENRDCQDDVGCNEIYNGQAVMVPDYDQQEFTARIYKYRDRTNPQDA